MQLFEVVSVLFSVLSFLLCSFVVYMYMVYPGTRTHPNQIVMHHAFTDLIFSISVLLSVYLNYVGDKNCQSLLGRFTSALTEYSLFGSELSYFFLAVDGLVSVSRPFSNPKTRYTFYATTTHVVSFIFALIVMLSDFVGRHAIGYCWIESTPDTVNIPSWEFLFFFVILIYVTSAILLMVMAHCLNSLPVIQETLLRARAEALESMMLYVFIYIIYGLCICVLYGLNVMINNHFKTWTPHFVSSTVLELIFYVLLTSRGSLTSFIFLHNFWSRGGKEAKRGHMLNKENVWYREVQPLFNNVIRNQILDIFSDGVKRCTQNQTFDDPQTAFDMEKGPYSNVLTQDSYYTDACPFPLNMACCSDAEKGDHVMFCEYSPIVFAYLRYKANIYKDEYIAEFENLSDCSVSEGSSGALFVRTNQNRFIIKFVNKSEFDVLRSILKDMAQYITDAEERRRRENFPEDSSYQGASSPYDPTQQSNLHAHGGMASVLQGMSDSEMKEVSELSQSFIQPENAFPSFQNSEEILLSSEEWMSSQPYFSHGEQNILNCSANNSRSDLLRDHRNPNASSASSLRIPDSDPSVHTAPPGTQSYHSRASSGVSPRGETPMWSATEGYVQARSRVEGSFLNRYLGMYTLEIFGQTLYFVVMENLLPYRNIDEIYDLKGSWIDRNPRKFHKGQLVTCKICNRMFQWGVSDKNEVHCQHEASIVKKDSDFKPCIRVTGSLNQFISNQLREDVDFLYYHGLMDYSLLVGYKDVAICVSANPTIQTNINPGYDQIPYASSVIQGPGLVFIGIIDYLQKYTFAKKLERFWKVVFRRKDRDGISDMPPHAYKDRFLERVIGKLFLDDADQYFTLNPFPADDKEPRRFSTGGLSSNTYSSSVNRRDTVNSGMEPFIQVTTESMSRVLATPQVGDDSIHGDSVHPDEFTEVRLVSGSSRSSGVSGNSGVSIQCSGDNLQIRRHSSLSTQPEGSREGGDAALDTIYESGSYMDNFTQREIV